MASIDTLPPDQHAVLELVLKRGRSYDEIAELLSIDRAGVRERALAALDALGPQTSVPATRRALITDYLLGALPPAVAEQVRDHLGESPGERAWARVVAAELQSLASGKLPEISVEVGGRAREPERAPVPEPAAAAEADAAPSETPGPSPAPARSRAGRPPRSSRAGGAMLLAAGAAVVVAIVLVLVLSGGSSKKHPAPASASRSTTPAASATGTTTTPQIVAQINLKPPAGGKSPLGVAEVLREQGRTGIAIVAQGLAPNSRRPPNAYAVWLYNSPTDSHILGFVNPGVGTNGRLQTAGGLPTNASHYQKLVVTLETQSNPKTPGTIILEGTLTGV